MVLPFPLVGPSVVMAMVVHPPGDADYSTNAYAPFAAVAAAAAAVGDDDTHQRDMLPHEHYNQTNS